MSKHRNLPRPAPAPAKEPSLTTAPELLPREAPPELVLPEPGLVEQVRLLRSSGLLEAPGAAQVAAGEAMSPEALEVVKGAVPGALEALEARMARDLAALYAVGY